MKRISIQIANKDRHSEIALLLQSLRTQTYKEWDLVILDENQTPIELCNFLVFLLNRIKLENHAVNIIRNNLPLGVCNARNKLLDEDYFGNPYVCRLDDDVILEPDYLQKLVQVIESEGYDIASGVTPLLSQPEVIRKSSVLSPIINEKVFNKEGDLIKHGDDCGFCYDERVIKEAHEFRSNALMKKEVADKVRYPKNLSPVGFREEAFFSLDARTLGFRIGVDTSAKVYHLQSPTGGCRFPDYGLKVQSDDEYFKRYAKKWHLKSQMK